MAQRGMATISLALLMVMVVASCSKGAAERSALLERVDDYFVCERQRDIECLWRFRPPHFRNKVSLNVFSDEVRKNLFGWEFVELKVTSAQFHSDAVFSVMYSVTEIAPEGQVLYGQPMGGRPIKFEELMEWWKVDDRWYAIDVGIRGRFGFGSGFELSKIQ